MQNRLAESVTLEHVWRNIYLCYDNKSYIFILGTKKWKVLQLILRPGGFWYWRHYYLKRLFSNLWTWRRCLLRVLWLAKGVSKNLLSCNLWEVEPPFLSTKYHRTLKHSSTRSHLYTHTIARYNRDSLYTIYLAKTIST